MYKTTHPLTLLSDHPKAAKQRRIGAEDKEGSLMDHQKFFFFGQANREWE